MIAVYLAVLFITIFGLFYITNQHIDESTKLILKKLKDLEDKTK